MPEQLYYCEKCKKTMNANQFYGSNNLEKYPEGKVHLCKQCMTMHVDNWDPSTFIWILEECDVPYVQEEWDKLLEKYGRDASKVTGTTIVGRYLSKMRLKKWKDYRFKDSQFLQELSDHKKEETMRRQGYDAVEIAKALEDTGFSVPRIEPLQSPQPEPEFIEEDISPIEDELTDEDKMYLRLKWGKSYKPEEWVKLEQLYEDMMNSYDIQLAGHIDTLKKVCKISLKADQLLDLGDIEGAQKAIKMYESMMKAGNFTATQNKAENEDYATSISELVAICETEGFIPRYYTEQPQDKVDWVLKDLEDYTRSLVENETNIAQMIDKALKQIEIDKENKAANNGSEDDSEVDLERLFNTEKDYLEPQDIIDFNDMLDDLEEQDNGGIE